MTYNVFGGTLNLTQSITLNAVAAVFISHFGAPNSYCVLAVAAPGQDVKAARSFSGH